MRLVWFTDMIGEPLSGSMWPQRSEVVLGGRFRWPDPADHHTRASSCSPFPAATQRGKCEWNPKLLSRQLTVRAPTSRIDECINE